MPLQPCDMNVALRAYGANIDKTMTASTPPAPIARTTNPFTWLLLVGLLLWSLFVTLAVQGSTLWLAWMTDLSKMETSAQAYLAGGIWMVPLLLVPALLLLLLKEPRQAAAVRTMVLATLAAGLLLLPRILFPPEAIYLAGWTRFGISAAFGLALLVWSALKGRVRRSPGSGFGLAIIIALLFLMPWLLYGALGDAFDVLTALSQAFGLALLAAGLASYLMPALAKHSDNPLNNIWLGGITLSVALVIIAGAWGQMDYQALLIGILPGLGFPLAILGIDDDRYDVISAVFMITLAIFGPLAFADPRETRLIALVSEETALWSLRATTINFFTGWFLTLVLGLFHTRVLHSRLSRHWLKLAGVAFVAAIALHFMFGQPGFYGDSFFVVLKDQADLSHASAIDDVDARRAWVYETLTEHADETQPELLSWLDQRHLPYQRYYLVNGLEVKANAIRRWQVARHPAVERVIYNPNLRPIPELPSLGSGIATKPEEIPWGIEAIGAPRVWSELGITGEGVVVGQSDSGADASHPALASTYRGRDNGDAYNWYDPWYGKPAPYDINGHGTHTLGTALGQTGVGVAPGASWFACANLVRAFGSTSLYLDCMQFMLAPHPSDGDPLHDGRPDLAADISTNSWGCPPQPGGLRSIDIVASSQRPAKGRHFLRCGSRKRRPWLQFDGNATGQLRQCILGGSHRSRWRSGWLLQSRARHPITRCEQFARIIGAWRGSVVGLAWRTMAVFPRHFDGNPACRWRRRPHVVSQSQAARRHRRHRTHSARNRSALQRRRRWLRPPWRIPRFGRRLRHCRCLCGC